MSAEKGSVVWCVCVCVRVVFPFFPYICQVCFWNCLDLEMAMWFEALRSVVGLWVPWFFHHNSNSMEISFSCNSIAGDHITTKFCTRHDSIAVMPCAKFCSDHFIRIWMRGKWNFHRIWIVMERLLVKWAPDQPTFCSGSENEYMSEVRGL